MSIIAPKFNSSFSKSYLVQGDHFLFNCELKCTSDVLNYMSQVFLHGCFWSRHRFLMFVCHRIHVRDHARHYGRYILLLKLSFYSHKTLPMMTSSNGVIFRVTGPLCGEFTGPGEFPAQRPVTRNFDVFFDLRLNKRLSKQPWGWWFETLSWSLWRQCNAYTQRIYRKTFHLIQYGQFWNMGEQAVIRIAHI